MIIPGDAQEDVPFVAVRNTILENAQGREPVMKQNPRHLLNQAPSYQGMQMKTRHQALPNQPSPIHH
eukprot:9650956-Prorocentrum_lima.AAC.1